MFGEVARDDLNVVAGLTQNVAENLAGPGSDVENAAKAADVELPGSQHVADQWVVQRNDTAQPDRRTARAIVELPDGVAVLAVVGSPDSLEFHKSLERPSDSWRAR
jgi:hypothetical protein